MTVNLALVVLKEYREWIESLGYDREWRVQSTQSGVFRRLVLTYSGIGAFSYPLTHDSYVVVLNSVDLPDFVAATRVLEKDSPRGLSVHLGSGEDYVRALSSAKPVNLYSDDLRLSMAKGGLSIVAHVDINGYRAKVLEKGWLETWRRVTMLTREIDDLALSMGGLAFYAGGDNVIAFLPTRKALDSFVEKLEFNELKVGVGIAPKPRRALELAARSLDRLREAYGREGLRRGLLVSEEY